MAHGAKVIDLIRLCFLDDADDIGAAAAEIADNVAVGAADAADVAGSDNVRSTAGPVRSVDQAAGPAGCESLPKHRSRRGDRGAGN